MTLKYQETSTKKSGIILKIQSQAHIEKYYFSTQQSQSQNNQSNALNNLKRLDCPDQKTITYYAEKYNQYCCEFSFPSLYLWDDIYHYEITSFNHWLVIIDPENDYCLMPLGENITVSGLQQLSETLKKAGYSGDISNAPPAFIETFPELSRYYDIENDRGMAEYIYTTEKLVELRGKKLRKKKNHISQFKRKYPDYQVKTMDSSVRDDCLALSENMAKRIAKNASTETDSEGILLDEIIAIRKAFNSFDRLPLEGIAIYVEKSLIAYAIYSRLNKDVFTIHFEKANYNYHGIAQVINWETAKALKEHCTYINREQDLDIPGLRKAKLSYEPALIYPANYLSFRG